MNKSEENGINSVVTTPAKRQEQNGCQSTLRKGVRSSARKLTKKPCYAELSPLDGTLVEGSDHLSTTKKSTKSTRKVRKKLENIENTPLEIWEKRRKTTVKRRIRGSSALFELCDDNLIPIGEQTKFKKTKRKEATPFLAEIEDLKEEILCNKMEVNKSDNDNVTENVPTDEEVIDTEKEMPPNISIGSPMQAPNITSKFIKIPYVKLVPLELTNILTYQQKLQLNLISPVHTTVDAKSPCDGYKAELPLANSLAVQESIGKSHVSRKQKSVSATKRNEKVPKLKIKFKFPVRKTSKERLSLPKKSNVKTVKVRSKSLNMWSNNTNLDAVEGNTNINYKNVVFNNNRTCYVKLARLPEMEKLLLESMKSRASIDEAPSVLNNSSDNNSFISGSCNSTSLETKTTTTDENVTDRRYSNETNSSLPILESSTLEEDIIDRSSQSLSIVFKKKSGDPSKSPLDVEYSIVQKPKNPEVELEKSSQAQHNNINSLHLSINDEFPSGIDLLVFSSDDLECDSRDSLKPVSDIDTNTNCSTTDKDSISEHNDACNIENVIENSSSSSLRNSTFDLGNNTVNDILLLKNSAYGCLDNTEIPQNEERNSNNLTDEYSEDTDIPQNVEQRSNNNNEQPTLNFENVTVRKKTAVRVKRMKSIYFDLNIELNKQKASDICKPCYVILENLSLMPSFLHNTTHDRESNSPSIFNTTYDKESNSNTENKLNTTFDVILENDLAQNTLPNYTFNTPPQASTPKSALKVCGVNTPPTRQNLSVRFSEVKTFIPYSMFNTPTSSADKPNTATGSTKKINSMPLSNKKLNTSTPSNKRDNSVSGTPKVKLGKMPNFAKLHKNIYDKMENLEDHLKRKENRAKLLLSGKAIKSGNTHNKSSSSTNKMDVSKKRNSTNNKSSSCSNKKSRISENDRKSKERVRTKLKLKDSSVRENEKQSVATKSKFAANSKIDSQRNYVKGVRSNRRFELLMNMRRKHATD